MESTIVVKVKYGKILRRFNANVDQSERLDFDMGGLREKVLSLFNFAGDSDLILTYIDEDGDVVTLVDDEDLHDAVRQSLNPLRITVKLNADKGGRPYARSSGSSTPMRSPQVQHSSPNLSTGFTELMKSVPESYREAISKLSLDLLSKATNSAPGLVELIESLSKMGQSSGDPVSENHAGTGSGPHSGVSESTMDKSVGKHPKAPKDDGIASEMLPNLKFEGPAPSSNLHLNLGNMMDVAGTSVTPASGTINYDLPNDPFLSGFSSADHAAFPSFATVSNKEVVEKSGECHQTGKSDVFHAIGSTLVAPKIPASDDSKKSVGVVASAGTSDPMSLEKQDSRTIEFGDAMSKQFPFNGCPFTGMPLTNDSVATHVQFPPRVHPFKRSFTHSDGLSSTFHRGVRCDGCGVHPITGPRFKSKLKEDYDLCSICFSELGNEADYIRMDRPIFPRQPWSFRKPHVRPPALPHVLRSGGMKPIRPKLDSRFIRDVNVLDGTVMAPSTPFTKIWRMRNNGTIVWPQGTQLVWIGGDRLSNSPLVDVEIFADGLPAEKELDISVDFTAPELPGRYISYWRLASPSGQKFGQRVWVLIQVVDLEDSLCDSLHGLNLNLPPISNGLTGPEIINVNVEPMVDDSISETNNSKRTELRKPVEVEISNRDLEQNFHIDDNLLVGSGGVSNHNPPQVPSSVLYPIIDLSDVAPTDPHPAPSNAPSTQGVGRNNDVEQTLLRELDEMGFKQIELNKEILRMNEYDLERSVDDLCGVSEWDPILEELLEMGFCDEEMNRRLLKKNKGSIKHVVMDLIAGEKA